MEPRLPVPDFSPERAPTQGAQTGEYVGNIQSPELKPGIGLEVVREQVHNVAGRAAPAEMGPPQAATHSSGIARTPLADDDLTTESDEDLIAKEWVDKAKKIVIATRDDPYSQEREVSKLQASYLQKRYGKELKLSNQ